MTVIQSKTSLKSTYINQQYNDTNYYTSSTRLIRNVNLIKSNAIFRVNLFEDLPPGTWLIQSVKLKFYISSSSSHLSPVSPLWFTLHDEQPSGAGNILVNQTTWNRRNIATLWGTPGGDYSAQFHSMEITALGWQEVDITAWAEPTKSNFEKYFFLTNSSSWALLTFFESEFSTTPGREPYLEITYITPPARTDIGYFTLGGATLGNGPLRGDVSEPLTISDSIKVAIAVFINEYMFIIENLNGTTYAYFNETLTLTEAQSYLSDYLAGVKGIITVPIDVTSGDFCATILESGQQLALNGVSARAFIFTKQTSQNFNIGTKILPGDAVMFTCPDLAVVVGDTVIWDGKAFRVAESINHYFANTIIYIKHALQRIRYTVPVLQVIGLVASENLAGKTTLTWIEVDFETFDHYEVWENLIGGATPEAITGIPATGPGTVIIQTGAAYIAGKYVIGQTITIQGSNGNDEEYTILNYQDNGGFDEIIISTAKELNATAPLGYIVNLSYYWKKDTTKSNTLSVKNIAPNTIYYYLVRAVDKYGNAGWWSNEAATPVNQTKPDAPEGLR